MSRCAVIVVTYWASCTFLKKTFTVHVVFCRTVGIGFLKIIIVIIYILTDLVFIVMTTSCFCFQASSSLYLSSTESCLDQTPSTQFSNRLQRPQHCLFARNSIDSCSSMLKSLSRNQRSVAFWAEYLYKIQLVNGF